MKIPAKFKEYIWLVNTIRKARRITYVSRNVTTVVFLKWMTNLHVPFQIVPSRNSCQPDMGLTI